LEATCVFEKPVDFELTAERYTQKSGFFTIFTLRTSEPTKLPELVIASLK
jgi:hypothetical protein